jgi:hypothetical protein
VPTRSDFEPAFLPSEIKEELCKGLLNEFGIHDVREHARTSELVHGCRVSKYHSDQDRNPTASLNFDRLTFKCLGCKASGGILWFISQMRGCSTREAYQWISDQTGTGGSTLDLTLLLQMLDALEVSNSSRVPIPTYPDRFLDPWRLTHPYLTDPRSEGGRGIPLTNVLSMQLGYAYEYPVSEHQTSERIVIPHFWDGRLVGWQTRRLAADGTPKYLSSPDFPKDRTVYNYQRARSIAVVVEAPLSVVQHVHALPMEATFGASVTEDQVALLAKHPTVVLFFDNDDGGWDAVQGRPGERRGDLGLPGLAERLSPYSNVLVVENPYDADAGEMTTQDVSSLIAEAVPYSVWSKPTTLMCYRCKSPTHPERKCP